VSDWLLVTADVHDPRRIVFGEGSGLAILAGALALAIWTARQRWWRGLVAVAAVPITIAIVDLALKPWVHRRFPQAGLMYPSGHVSAATAVATLTVVLLAWSLPARGVRSRLTGVMAVAVGLMVVGVVTFDMHWPIDAAAGIPTGLACTLAWCLLIDAVADVRAHRRGRRELLGS